MGKAAKITRGGNKKRVNPGRAEAKQKALGAKSHTATVKEAAEARKAVGKKSLAIAGALKAKGSASIVRMIPRTNKKEAEEKNRNESA